MLPSKRVLALAATGVALVLVSACGNQVVARAQPLLVAGSPGSPTPAPTLRPSLPQTLPNLGPHTLAEVPATANQVVEVLGDDVNSPLSKVILFQRTDAGWQASPAWAAHNAAHGWVVNHLNGDLRSPIGVFGLTDAGGLRPDPGSKLAYDQSHGFTISGTGFAGEPLKGSFDYVVAINYNRKPGTTPLDWTMPMGAAHGTGIWSTSTTAAPRTAASACPKRTW